MSPTTRDNLMHAVEQLVDAATRTAGALGHHRHDIPPGFAWDAHELEAWAEQVRLWMDAVQADPGLPHILAEDVAFLQCPRCAGEVAPGAMLYDPISGEPDTCRECDAEDDA